MRRRTYRNAVFKFAHLGAEPPVAAGLAGLENARQRMLVIDVETK